MNANINKETENKENNTHVLYPGINYTIGKFQCLLDENTGDLRILVHTNSDTLKITPRSGNSISVQAIKF